MPVWTTLRHNGVAFPPEHHATGLTVSIAGESVALSPLAEEMAYQFAKKKDTPYVKDPVFVENFMKYFSKELPPKFRQAKFSDVDFSRFYRLVDKEKREKEAVTKDEKKRLAASRKEQREALKSKHGKAVIDGKEVDIANWLVEPPGLFMGRGAHPLRGSWKPRVGHNDVTLNLDESAPRPAGDWGAVVHDRESIWMARWIDKLTEREKYVWPHESSAIQQSRNKEKYDKALRIESKLNLIRRTILQKMSARDVKSSKIATVAFLIDRLGMRVGDEKEEDEADTVGATTLRVEHIKLLGDKIEFDFLGKDSVTGDSELYYKIDGKLYYSTFEELVRRVTPSKYWKDSEGRELILPSALLQVLTVDEPNQRRAKIMWAPVTEVMSHTVSKPIFSVELAGGRRIGVTGDHSLFIQNKSNPYFAVASPVRKMSTLDSVATISTLPIDQSDLPSVNSIRLTDDLLTFCGLWLADGCYTQKSVIISAGADEEILSFIGSVSKSYHSDMEIMLEKVLDSDDSAFNNYQRGRAQTVLSQLRDRGNAFSYHMNEKGDIWCFSVTLVRLLQQLGLKGYSTEKDIPEWMHNLSNRQIGLVLKGYFSGDGGVSRSKDTVIIAGSASRKLIEHVRTLLSRLGIDSTINQAKGKSGFKASGPQWVLHIGRNEGKAKFISSVRFMQKSKNAGIQISRVRYERFPLSWRRIRSIAPQASNHGRVYDLSVRGTERFITNGILAHNSVRWVKTMENPEEVLMKNLKRFTQGKKPQDEVFDVVTSSMVNHFLSGIVPDLTAKVFRTYHATKVTEESLRTKDVRQTDELEKLYFAKEANLAAAVFCNHKRTPPKNWDESLKKKEEKLAEYKAKGKETMVRKMAMNVEFTKKTKDYNLNTSLKNYIDPRVYKSWCDYAGLDWAKLYTTSLQKKFSWVEKSKKPWSKQEQVVTVPQQD